MGVITHTYLPRTHHEEDHPRQRRRIIQKMSCHRHNPSKGRVTRPRARPNIRNGATISSAIADGLPSRQPRSIRTQPAKRTTDSSPGWSAALFRAQPGVSSLIFSSGAVRSTATSATAFQTESLPVITDTIPTHAPYYIAAIAILVLGLQLVLSGAKPDNASGFSCPVTIGTKSSIDPAKFFGAVSAVWNGNLYVGGLWPNGTIVFRPQGAGHIYPDGSLGMKIAWYRANRLRGKLTIHGKRLDSVAPPLHASVDSGYGDNGFQPSEVIFPTEGCWQVTGTVADTSVTFVTRVVKAQ